MQFRHIWVMQPSLSKSVLELLAAATACWHCYARLGGGVGVDGAWFGSAVDDAAGGSSTVDWAAPAQAVMPREVACLSAACLRALPCLPCRAVQCHCQCDACREESQPPATIWCPGHIWLRVPVGRQTSYRVLATP